MRATDALRTALQELLTEKGLSWPAKAVIAPPKDARHGDLAANIAMLLAKDAGRNPRELAQELADALPARCADVAGAEVAWRRNWPTLCLPAARMWRARKWPGRAF